MKYVGLCIFALGAVLIYKKYTSYLEHRVLLASAFLDFLKHVRTRISCFLTPVSELCEGYESPPLTECGFLPLLKEGKSLAYAYERVSISFCFDEKTDTMIKRTLSSLGEGYREDGIREIDLALVSLGEFCESLSNKTNEEKRIVSVVGTALVVGMIILFL